MSGLVADSRTLVDHARVECASHWFVYNADMKVESVAQAVSNLAIRFGDADDDGPAMVREGEFDVFKGLGNEVVTGIGEEKAWFRWREQMGKDSYFI